MHRLVAVCALAVVAFAQPAHAFSLQIHSLLANKTAANLYANANKKLKLEFRNASIEIAQADGDAIVKNQRAWRGGVLGPDNTIFPAMTDISHAIGTAPFQQCQEMYKVALASGSGGERAYALGCFFHGVTDNVAHHVVNFFTGETFTLAPTPNTLPGKSFSGFDNVIRHILFEGLIEAGIKEANPDLFQAAYFTQIIPNQLMLRTYLDTESAIWYTHTWTEELMEQKGHKGLTDDCGGEYACGTSARGVRYLSFLATMTTEGFAAYPLLIPDMTLEGQRAFTGVPSYFENIKSTSRTDGDLAPIDPGGDGDYGTLDDEPDCRMFCPIKYAKYFLSVFLTSDSGNGQTHIERLMERKIAALDKVPASYEQSIGNLSNKMTQVGMINMGPSGVTESMAPFTSAIAASVTLGYDDVAYLLPNWVRQVIENVSAVRNAIKAIFDIFKGVIEWVMKPFKEYVNAKIHAIIDPILADLRNKYDPIKKEYEDRLETLTGDRGWLGHNWQKSVFVGNTLNNAYAVLKSRSRVLATKTISGVKVVTGPRTFDAGFQLEASNQFACESLRKVYFPHGITVGEMLGKFNSEGVLQKATDPLAQPNVECYDGAINKFTTTPNETNCKMTSIKALSTTPKGSWTNAFPVALRPAAERPSCAASADDPNAESGDSLVDEWTGDCGCSSTGGLTGPGMVLFALMGVGLLRRRRARAL